MGKINYQPGIQPLGAASGNTSFWSKYMSDLLDKYGVPEITISSTYRSPRQQAVAMYNNIVAFGVKSQYALYINTADQVVKVYEVKHNYGYGKDDILKAMEEKIVELKMYGAHGKIDPDFICFDVPPQTIKDKGTFERMMRSVASKFIPPGGGEPVYHTEITKGVAGVVAQTSKVVPVIILIITGYVMYKRFKGEM